MPIATFDPHETGAKGESWWLMRASQDRAPCTHFYRDRLMFHTLAEIMGVVGVYNAMVKGSGIPHPILWSATSALERTSTAILWHFAGSAILQQIPDAMLRKLVVVHPDDAVEPDA